MSQMPFLFSFATDLWWTKRFSRDVEVRPTHIFGMFRTNYAVDEASTFTGEGISEVERLMGSAGMDDVAGK